MPLPRRPKTCVERDYEALYAIDVGGEEGHDQVVYRHPNGLCVVCLAPTHPLLRGENIETDESAVKVDYDVGKGSRLDTQPSGKRKRGAMEVHTNTELCQITSAGVPYSVRACIKGKLLEVNEQLVKQPHLLWKDPRTAGYVAIIMPKNSETSSHLKETLKSTEEYYALRGATV
mmetsp:Transcript_22036/g.36760  ORF Transcript_22036/g.36760 Transcript_22036/m.36760 type:complete len:174 (-) Transcript_22036:99-620(-)|eukprot:CAMPEP_0198210558 /NCGR_PEP_ID=MMETSP1445-20131203/20668_1 /TAXON_ID=36898 /ORGANISM="Pyramimonas sp., Strain CCMP2087" /LENGTH=173 /DNA_ID=CAMNT_0043884647 /DNA_START=200 /DNA_END=721 /DNA_ORIENTATION=+